MNRTTVALALAVALSTSACAPFRKINVYTVPQEMAIGEIFSTEVSSYYPILGDPIIDWYLNHRGRQLADVSDRHDLPYSFNVVDSPELNAFAIPGGHIYVNLGMIEASANESELVALLAHEIGHVIAKHSMRQISQQSIIQIVGTIAMNQYPNQWAALAANLFGTTGFLKMSRDDEREADAIGVELMMRAGYDPQGMATVHEMLLKKYDNDPGMLDKLFSTHPPSRERIDNVRRNLEGREVPTNLLRTTPTYQSIYSHLVQTYYTEAGRRRWRDVLANKEQGKEAEKEKDRLPWDIRSDEERRKQKEKEEAEQAKRRDRRQEKEEKRPDPAPSPTATPVPVLEPEPQPGAEATPFGDTAAGAELTGASGSGRAR